jgi:hypothetical protein
MASLLTTVELPYPKDEHRLRPPADSALVARLAIEVGTTSSAGALVGFYQHCDGVDLPDIWNGYWLHPAELILRHRQEDPTGATIGFGSDGGGNTFALRIADGAVVLQRWWRPDEVVAPDFPAFLERLRLEVDAFVHHTQGWQFLDGGHQ